MEALSLMVGLRVVSAELTRRGAVVWAAQAEYEGVEDLTRAIAELGSADGAPRGRRRVHVTLDASLGQVRMLTEIPPVSERCLGELVALQSGRFFRRNGKPLATDARWLERRKRDRRTVIAAAVEEPVLDAIADGVSAGGLALGTIRPAGDQAARLRFRSRAAAFRRSASLRRQVRVLFLLGGVAWAAAATLLVMRNRNYAVAIRAEIAALEEPARAAIEARRALNEAAAAVEVIAATEAARGRMALRLVRSVDSLRDGAFLSVLDLPAEGK
jgi:hypothetical protein